jgi:hypothetical protein
MYREERPVLNYQQSVINYNAKISKARRCEHTRVRISPKPRTTYSYVKIRRALRVGLLRQPPRTVITGWTTTHCQISRLNSAGEQDVAHAKAAATLLLQHSSLGEISEAKVVDDGFPSDS